MEIPLPVPTKEDIYSYGFDKMLVRPFGTEGTQQNSSLAYDMISGQVAAPLVSSGLLSLGSAGEMTVKSITMGGTSIQYTIGNQGYFTFGDGTDGEVTITADTTLTADKYYDTLTINPTFALNPGGYRIFVRKLLTINGIIQRNGNAGGVGTDGQSPDTSGNNRAGGGGGGAGVALAAGYLNGSPVGVAGSSGGAGGNNDTVCANNAGVAGTAGNNGTATSNSIGSNGVVAGAGGSGGSTAACGGGGGAGAAGGAGTATASSVKLIANWHLATLLDVGSTGTTTKFDNSAGSGSGGGGGGGRGGNAGAPNTAYGAGGGGGGGSGSGGGIIAIYAKEIIISSTGTIRANGGNGGVGGNGGAANGNGTGVSGGGGGGGGGAGGNGGQIILVYNKLTNNGNLLVSGGSAGAGGTGGTGFGGGGAGAAGAAGTAGSAGTTRQFAISL